MSDAINDPLSVTCETCGAAPGVHCECMPDDDVYVERERLRSALAACERERDELRRLLDAEKEWVARQGAENVKRMRRLGVQYPNGLDSGIDALIADRDSLRSEVERLKAELERWKDEYTKQYDHTAQAIEGLIARAEAAEKRVRHHEDEAARWHKRTQDEAERHLATIAQLRSAVTRAEAAECERDEARQECGFAARIARSTAEAIATEAERIAEGYGKTTAWKALCDFAWHLRNAWKKEDPT